MKGSSILSWLTTRLNSNPSRSNESGVHGLPNNIEMAEKLKNSNLSENILIHWKSFLLDCNV
jgi:hypothetical protein